MKDNSFFSGRVIYDHLAKTAGQAVNHWLRDQLGNRCVTENLIGDHSELIRNYGGIFPIISGHLFFQSEGLDPKYRYFTVIREPIDRAVSWINYILDSIGNSPLASNLKIIEQFITNPDMIVSKELYDALNVNYYINHFYKIIDHREKDPEKQFSLALNAISEFDIIGLYEYLKEFTDEVSNYIGIENPEQLPRINVRRTEKEKKDISAKAIYVIQELNKRDIEFFLRVQEIYHRRKKGKKPIVQKKSSQIMKYEWDPSRKDFSSGSAFFIEAHLKNTDTIYQDDIVGIEAVFSIEKEIDLLDIGFHIFDSYGRWAFGTNTVKIESIQKQIKPDIYKAHFYFLAALPIGKYLIGFATRGIHKEYEEELFWKQNAIEIQVYKRENHDFSGYTNLQTSFLLTKTNRVMRFLCNHHPICTQVGIISSNSIVSTGQSGFIIHGPYIELDYGNYEAIIWGRIGKKGINSMKIEVTAKCGSLILNQKIVTSNQCEVDIVEKIEFNVVPNGSSDIETRIWVDDNCDVSFTYIDICHLSR